MAIIDTTNTVESAMFLKSRVPKNMVGENYYIKTLQQKIDAEWSYRYNVVDIEEEKNKQIVYTKKVPVYTPIEVVIQTVKSERGEALADDWKLLVFRDCKYNNFLGKRFRFNLDFDEGKTYSTEEEKIMKNSVWIAVNREQTSPTNGLLVRRCNTNVGFVGSPSLEYDNITEYHYEPCILESDFKGINLYYKSPVNIAQAEIYAIFQYNYFTQSLKINDRLIIGDTDLVVRDNNSVFKIKAINKFYSQNTFQVGSSGSISDVPLIVVALDKDNLNSKDDLEKRIAFNTTIYKVENEQGSIDEGDDKDITPKEDVYELQTSLYETKLIQGESQIIKCYLYNQNMEEIPDAIINYNCKLGTVLNPDDYYTFEQLTNNKFKLTNNKMWMKNKLEIEFICEYNEEKYTKVITIQLGGFY